MSINLKLKRQFDLNGYGYAYCFHGHDVIFANYSDIVVWDILQEKERNRVFIGSFIYCLTLTPDHDYLIGSTISGRIFACKMNDINKVLYFYGHDQPVFNVVAGEKNQMISGSADCSVCVWDITTQSCLKNYAIGFPVLCIAFEHENKTIYVADRNGGLTSICGEIQTSYPLKCFMEQLIVINGNIVVGIGAKDNSSAVYCWDLSKSIQPRIIRFTDSGNMLALAKTTDPLYVVAGSTSGTLRLINTTTFTVDCIIYQDPDHHPLYGANFSADGKYAVVGDSRHALLLFSLSPAFPFVVCSFPSSLGKVTLMSDGTVRDMKNLKYDVQPENYLRCEDEDKIDESCLEDTS